METVYHNLECLLNPAEYQTIQVHCLMLKADTLTILVFTALIFVEISPNILSIVVLRFLHLPQQ